MDCGLSGDTHDVDIMYTNLEVFDARYRINVSVSSWLAGIGKQGQDWGILDRYPDDGFYGETFQFRTAALAVMFKLRWGGA